MATHEYYIGDIHMLGNEHGKLASDVIYAKLYQTSNDRMVVSATLQYILQKIRDENLDVEGVEVTTGASSGQTCSRVNLSLKRDIVMGNSNTRSKRTLDNIIESIGTAEVRCGLCCSKKEPCDKCKEATRLANWHPIKVEEVEGFR